MGTLAEALTDAGYVDSPSDVDEPETARRLAQRVGELEAECAALAAALDEDRHEYNPDPADPGWCTCHYRADSRWHQTAAWVRRRLGFKTGDASSD